MRYNLVLTGTSMVPYGTECQEGSNPTVLRCFDWQSPTRCMRPKWRAPSREASRAALRRIMTRARASGLLDGNPVEMGEQFRGLLWCDLMVNLLLGVAEQPSPRAIAERARDATATFLRLHPLPG